MKLIILVASVLFCQGVYARDLELMLELGYARINDESNYRLTGQTSSVQNCTAFEVLVGYKFYSNFVIGGAVNEYAGWNFFGANDSVNSLDVSLFTGYSIDVGKNFKLLPMIGVSFWEYKATEGAFLNPGPEEEKVFRGNDIVGKLILEFPSQRLVGFNMSYTYGRYDFGTLQSLNCGIRFQFL